MGTENLFLLNNSFGKLLTEEVIEGLVILTNKSNREITISNLEISFNNEEKKTENNNEKYQKTLSINLPGPDNLLLFLPKQTFSIKIQNYLKYPGKYTINVNFKTKCPVYTQQYFSSKQKAKIKDFHKDFIINKDNQIELIINKIFSFQVYNPFIIKEEFRLNQMKEEYLIEISIKNQSMYFLTLPDLIIVPKTRSKNHIKQ